MFRWCVYVRGRVWLASACCARGGDGEVEGVCVSVCVCVLCVTSLGHSAIRLVAPFRIPLLIPDKPEGVAIVVNRGLSTATSA